jgi:geranylgeranyl reductase family protein
MYDCIIVGAGPAGSTTAYTLARQGHRVLLLEQAALTRLKPCTGAVSPNVARWIDLDLTPGLDRTERRLRYTWRLEDEVRGELKGDQAVWLVRREVFDPFLAEQAQRAGATVQDQTPVTGLTWQGDRWQVETATDTYTGRYVVGADGAKGPMAGWLGLDGPKRRPAVTLEIPDAIALTPETDALNFEFGWVKNGCVWGFPRQQGYTCGLVNFIGKTNVDLQTPLEHYAKALGLDPSQGTITTATVKLWDGNRPLHTQQAVLVGEAAALVDPISAEGIRPGIYSGGRAAAAIHQALRGDPDALAGYSRTIHQEWGADMQWAQRIAQLFYRVPGITYRVGIKRPTATERLGQILAGEVRYSDIANRVIKRLSTGFLPGRG